MSNLGGKLTMVDVRKDRFCVMEAQMLVRVMLHKVLVIVALEAKLYGNWGHALTRCKRSVALNRMGGVRYSFGFGGQENEQCTEGVCTYEGMKLC